MSETPKKMPGLDAVLRDWPEASSGDDRTKSVMSRIALGERGASASYVSDDDLFADPLGLSEDDRHNEPGATVSHSTPQGAKMNSLDRERDRKNLQDLAKMAQGKMAQGAVVPSTRQVTSKKDDSGIVDLAAASKADPGATVRAQTTPLASHSLFDDGPAPVVHQQPAPSVPPPAIDNVRPLVAEPARHKKNNVVAFAIGGFLAMAGVAAGAVLYAHSHVEPAPVVAVTTAAPTVAASAAPIATATQVVADNTPADPANAGVDLNALPSAPAASGHHRHHPAAIGGGSDDAPVVAAAKVPPSGRPANLNDAMKSAAGDDAVQRPAAASNGSASMGNVPQKPSQGAVTGALGAVLPGARSCLGPDDPISRASVVFNSDGSVSSVTVTGGAQGKPAEACIKDKLRSARLQPFAEPSYTANITVRHN